MAINRFTALYELLTLNVRSRIAFSIRFWKGILRFRSEYDKAFRRYSTVFPGRTEQRALHVNTYLLNAFNALLLSGNLLIQCSMMPSGNLMRNFVESVAVAILLASRKLPYYKTFSKDPTECRPDQLSNELNKARVVRILALDPLWTERLLNIRNFYHPFSHAGATSVSSMLNRDGSPRLLLGSFYDDSRRREYRMELIRRVTACEQLAKIVTFCSSLLDAQ